MVVSENTAVFFSNPVRDYHGPTDWDGVETAYRLRVEGRYDQDRLIEKLDALVEHPDAPLLQALVIGRRNHAGEDSSAEMIQALIQRRHRLSGLLAIFLGDIAHEESTTTGIQNSDVSPLLNAFPHLEVLRIRGGQGLRFSKIQHEFLRVLVVESGGLPSSVIHDIGSCEFPNLVHLDLWLGSSPFGWDGSIDDIWPILDGKYAPNLRYLGLQNSEIADDIASAIVDSPLMGKLRVLDLSSNNLTDTGGRALLHLPWNAALRRLVLHRHGMSRTMSECLHRDLPCKLSLNGSYDRHEPGHSVPNT